MTALSATVEGIGFWCDGLPSWQAARAFAAGGALPADAPAKPSPQLLAPNERRRAPESVAVALEVSLAACEAARRDPATLASVFASTHGDLAITDYMCATLASDPGAISPTKFHNSVHNAAAGYWTIGTGCMQATTAISAFDASFAQGLVEALLQLGDGRDAVLLAAYDARAVGALAQVSRSDGVLGAALVLSNAAPAAPSDQGAIRLHATIEDGPAPAARGPLARHAAGNAMAPMLGLFDALAAGDDGVLLPAGPDRRLRVRLMRKEH